MTVGVHSQSPTRYLVETELLMSMALVSHYSQLLLLSSVQKSMAFCTHDTTDTTAASISDVWSTASQVPPCTDSQHGTR